MQLELNTADLEAQFTSGQEQHRWSGQC